VVAYARLSDLPPEAAVDRQAWLAWGIRSNLNIPVIIADSTDWVFSVNQVRHERVWSEEAVQRFKLLGEILAGAIERSQTDLALRESEERLNLAAAAAGAGIWVLSTATGKFWATPKGLEIFQYPAEAEMTFDRLLALVHPDDRDRVRAAAEQSRSHPDRLQIVEYRIVHPDGSTRWVVSRGRSYPGESGAVERIMGVTIDVSERKAMEETLRRRLAEIDALKLQLERENVYLREEIQLQHGHEEIVGRSAGMKKVLAQVERVARTDATVLLQGETGTGKELLARTIHRLSGRRERPLVTINCAVLPPTLIESELFGRERGAYTGAMTRMAGRFELADRSTLFLDEIGELPPDLQAKLLRAIEEGRFERLGSTKPLKVDVRIVAATNRDLAQEVAAGRFRRDLYYRLNVFPILVPPLRERPEDVPPLVWAFAKQFEKKLGKRVEHIPRQSMEELQRYQWPGNARELRNIVEYALITSEGGTLRLSAPRRVSGEIPADATLQEAERRYIAKVLEQCAGRIAGRGGAAEILGIKRTTLQSRMKKLGIQRSATHLPK
jgi:PAS domain S-box-containing protein